MQELIVILIVVASAGWLGWQVYRYLRPAPGGKGCAGGCCDGQEAKPAQNPTAPRTMMISSDDLRARLKARDG